MLAQEKILAQSQFKINIENLHKAHKPFQIQDKLKRIWKAQ